MPGVRRAARHLNRGAVPGRSTEAQNQLLHGQVAGVRRQLHQVAAEGDENRAAQGEANALEELEIEVGQAAFDPALDHAADPGSRGKVRSRPAAALAHGPDLAADADALLERTACRFDVQLGAPDAGHDRYMFI